MSDDPKSIEFPGVPSMPMLAPRIPEFIINQLDRSCELAKQGKLNNATTDATLKALAERWRTMNAFSKREQGEKDTLKTSDQPRPIPNAVQVAPGQEATVIGPATIYGGQVEDVKPVPTDKS